MLHRADHELFELAEDQDGIFTNHDADERGLTRPQGKRRIGSLWVPMHRGVHRMAGAPLTQRG
ncbi:MAG TPA: type IV toxin-antitoxin system AbiEi family antitoxin domain-containing protein, partial [Acidimicrobiia bacterium]|nr:type IV toxin-antitoxin system AbiEi family antitoxin domain-containing protein [Acidimicrobiia bacterium]